MSNKTYITDDHNLNDSSIAASSKAISNGLSALMDNIIVAANAAANSQTTIPNNNAVALSNRIEEVAAKNTEQDAAINAAKSSADAANAGLVGVVRSVNGVNADAAGNIAGLPIWVSSLRDTANANNSVATAPSGGTWRLYYWYYNPAGHLSGATVDMAGGASWTNKTGYTIIGIFIRKA